MTWFFVKIWLHAKNINIQSFLLQNELAIVFGSIIIVISVRCSLQFDLIVLSNSKWLRHCAIHKSIMMLVMVKMTNQHKILIWNHFVIHIYSYLYAICYTYISAFDLAQTFEIYTIIYFCSYIISVFLTTCHWINRKEQNEKYDKIEYFEVCSWFYWAKKMT